MNPAYLEDASGTQGHADAVHMPADEAELSAILQQANNGGIPVTIAGAGTGVAGGRVPSGGWIVSLERFRRLEIHSGYAYVGAGILLRDLQAAAARSGQFYAPDPTENSASIGGNISTNASGSKSFRYGATRRAVQALRVVLIDGTTLNLHRGEPVPFGVPEIPVPQTTKLSAGYLLHPGMDFVDLFIGSEGTLGVVTEATVQLLPAPAELLAGVIFFDSDEECLRAVESWRGIERLRMLEYLDRNSLDIMRPQYSDIPARAAAALMIEQEVLDGSELDEWAERLETATSLGESSWFASGDTDRERFRRFRHALAETVNATVRRRGQVKMSTDFAVPLSRNAEMLSFYRERLQAEFPGEYTIFGHIGDAHVHVNVLPHSPEDVSRARDLFVEFARKAVDLGGTVAAEHGIGKRKAHLLALQYAPEHIDAMRSVKRRLDPKWLLERGTLFAADSHPAAS